MTGSGSSFLGDANKAKEAFLGHSLNVMVCNTLKGPTKEFNESLDHVASYVASNPSTTKSKDFNAYKEKVVSAAGKNYFTNETGVTASQFISAASTADTAQVSHVATTTGPKTGL